jgi:hypothetical protein
MAMILVQSVVAAVVAMALQWWWLWHCGGSGYGIAAAVAMMLWWLWQ